MSNDWRENDLEVERRTRAAVQAVEKMNEGLLEFLAQTRDPDDVEIVEDALVIVQTRGMDSNGTYWKPGHLFLTRTGSANGVIGLLATQGAIIEEELLSPTCSCGDD